MSIGPVLLIGWDGMLGQAWRKLLAKHGIEYTAPLRDELDLTNAATIKKHVTARCPVVVNCAAYTAVDQAETQQTVAQHINGVAVGELSRQCKKVGTLLVHYSTDYVFDGEGDRPYSVDHPTAAINVYGHSKSMGEALIEQSGCRYLLVRTSWLYAPWGGNFVRTIAGLARKRDALNVVSDQRGRPTSSEHLAGITLALIDGSATGIYHVTDGGECTWHEFACEIARHVNPHCNVETCSSDAYLKKAKRPRYSVLDLSRAEEMLGPMPHWKDNLVDVLGQLESATT